MEAAKIDWKNLDSTFVEDALYEHINAPKWVDFLAPHQDLYVDDDAWFCRPDCRHPKTVEDFLKSTPNSKGSSSSHGFETIPLGEKNPRDANMKRRGHHAHQPSGSSSKIDCENQNPNLVTPPSQVAKSMKALLKSSSEKKPYPIEEAQAPSLKSALSARNLFAGKDILNHITEFCNELKKLAARVRERENVEKLDVTSKREAVKDVGREVLGELSGREKERTPLLEVRIEKSQGVKEKQQLRRKKRLEDGENIPMSLDLENVKRKGGEGLLPIRTCPPSPQCFSATRPPAKAPTVTPPKASRSKPVERGVLSKESPVVNNCLHKETSSVSSAEGREEARSLDVFWFLKPCTLST